MFLPRMRYHALRAPTFLNLFNKQNGPCAECAPPPRSAHRSFADPSGEINDLLMKPREKFPDWEKICESVVQLSFCHIVAQPILLHYLKRLLAPFYLSSKRYQIPFCNLPKGISYRMQNPKNPRK